MQRNRTSLQLRWDRTPQLKLFQKDAILSLFADINHVALYQAKPMAKSGPMDCLLDSGSARLIIILQKICQLLLWRERPRVRPKECQRKKGRRKKEEGKKAAEMRTWTHAPRGLARGIATIWASSLITRYLCLINDRSFPATFLTFFLFEN